MPDVRLGVGLGIGAVPEDAPVFVISVAAQLAGMHPQTLRQYDRAGLVSPGRTPGGGRRYSPRDVALLREVQRLSQEEGVNLAGIKRIIELESQVEALQARVVELLDELATTVAGAASSTADLQAALTADLSAAAAAAAAAVHASYRRDLVPMPAQTLVIWRPDR